jgi:copper oxidase (laccase) domain-containing protein
MVAHFGAKPENIRAAIGPNIGMCCFETDADVPQAMIAALGDVAKAHIRSENGKYYVNLKAINGEFLRRAGVTHIDISDACTKCENHRFWSHRITGKNRGSQGAIIVCKGVSL